MSEETTEATATSADPMVQPATEPATEPAAEPAAEPAVEPAVEESEGEGARNNREAAKYRVRLREVEAERDTISGRLSTYEREHVERIAAERMAVPADFFLVGDELDALRGKDGSLDEDRVRGAVEAVLADRPTWDLARQPRLPRPNPFQGGGHEQRASGREAFAQLVDGGA